MEKEKVKTQNKKSIKEEKMEENTKVRSRKRKKCKLI